ncbi:NHLP leader peptide family RiPP precursor [uncultured Thiohalocapsa sp.]|uniref:NHLP leader peptide family RiPP precursor n=1 Tax=uncultured Thiohalocapsa sp. TaxID=768990 RepID=UPI0025D8F46B|nr:NHLP leader peptide family RiPP precursor [uncultured Thiohalocapsa sp.]
MHEQSNQYQQLIAKCWADEAFKQKLMADPAGTLAAEGMTVPEGVTVRVAENTAQDLTLVIPAKPTELSDEAVSGVSGGGFSEPTYYLTQNSYICA